MALTIRPATPNDLAVTHEIKREAFGPYVELVYGWDEEDQWRRHQEEFSVQNVRIVEQGGEIVGYLLVRMRADVLYLSQIFIKADHQNQGIGAECMRLLRDEARCLGLPIKLQVLKVNPRAQAFYVRAGFRKVGETLTHVQFEHALESNVG